MPKLLSDQDRDALIEALKAAREIEGITDDTTPDQDTVRKELAELAVPDDTAEDLAQFVAVYREHNRGLPDAEIPILYALDRDTEAGQAVLFWDLDHVTWSSEKRGQVTTWLLENAKNPQEPLTLPDKTKGYYLVPVRDRISIDTQVPEPLRPLFRTAQRNGYNKIAMTPPNEAS